MKRVLKDTWTIFTQSVKEMDDPGQRLMWIIGFFLVCFVIVLSMTALLTGFVENLIEIIGNTITNTVIGEFPEVIEK